MKSLPAREDSAERCGCGFRANTGVLVPGSECPNEDGTRGRLAE
jgi:hypothetical protein